jgi:hypothetical protein
MKCCQCRCETVSEAYVGERISGLNTYTLAELLQLTERTSTSSKPSKAAMKLSGYGGRYGVPNNERRRISHDSTGQRW